MCTCMRVWGGGLTPQLALTPGPPRTTPDHLPRHTYTCCYVWPVDALPCTVSPQVSQRQRAEPAVASPSSPHAQPRFENNIFHPRLTLGPNWKLRRLEGAVDRRPRALATHLGQETKSKACWYLLWLSETGLQAQDQNITQRRSLGSRRAVASLPSGKGGYSRPRLQSLRACPEEGPDVEAQALAGCDESRVLAGSFLRHVRVPETRS